ncbi:MAG: hypothetical protein GY856_27300 [bacterium]|nr:hypothetical protein [bacterium]
MMDRPKLNENGDLPPGIHRATLAEVLAHFGWRTRDRRLMGRRFIIFGSFVTAKPDPGDVDIFMVMQDSFDAEKISREERSVFDHMVAHNYNGASVFWLRKGATLDGEAAAVEHWQIKRDGTPRGIVEVTDHD